MLLLLLLLGAADVHAARRLTCRSAVHPQMLLLLPLLLLQASRKLRICPACIGCWQQGSSSVRRLLLLLLLLLPKLVLLLLGPGLLLLMMLEAPCILWFYRIAAYSTDSS
jgi:hypothetical protein